MLICSEISRRFYLISALSSTVFCLFNFKKLHGKWKGLISPKRKDFVCVCVWFELISQSAEGALTLHFKGWSLHVIQVFRICICYFYIRLIFREQFLVVLKNTSLVYHNTGLDLSPSGTKLRKSFSFCEL